MRSKTSKTHPRLSFLWKAEQSYSEQELKALSRELALELKRGDRVVLEGALGAGKSTFARFLLESLGIAPSAEGSPSFAIAHEYESPSLGSVVHLDFYRLRDPSEIDEAGIPAYFWERDALTISEWLSSQPEFMSQVFESSPSRAIWRISLSFDPESDERRRVKVERTGRGD